MRRLAAVALISILFTQRGHAESPHPSVASGLGIDIDAEQITYDQKNNSVTARGNVVITRGDTELHADEVWLNRESTDATAVGHVKILSPEGTILADSVHFNLDEETGFLEDAQVSASHGHYSLLGKRVEKGLGQSYHIENGQFTTCHCNEGAPSWSVSGKQLDITLGGYGTLKGGTFNILGYPVMYVPQAVFPAQRDRQSGFLMPRFGASNTRGFQTLLPFYLAIDKSQDATLAFDTETSARAGLVAEYRYALSREARGMTNISFFNESFRGIEPAGVSQDRWSAVTDNTQKLGDHAQLYADAFVVSDDLFLREINTYAFDHTAEVAIRTLPFTQSHAGLLYSGDRFALTGEGTYYQDLTTGTESRTLQRAPELSLLGQTLLGRSLLGDLSANVVDFQRGSSTDGVRADIQPGVTLPLPLGSHVFGALRTSVRETAYHLTNDDDLETQRELPRDQSRELFQIEAEAHSALSRTYDVHWLGLEKLKHTLEPGLSYLYVPAVGQDTLPLFDGTDRVNHRNLVTYGLVSRFIGKFSEPDPLASDVPASMAAPDQNAAVREIARFSVAQSFDISRGIIPLQPGHAPSHFSDVDFDGRVNPNRAFSLRFHSSYDTGNNNISEARVGFFVEDPRPLAAPGDSLRLATRTSAGISYRFLTENLLQEVDANIVLRLTQWAGLLYSSRYDVVTNRFLDNNVGMRFISSCDCWAVDFAVTDRTNPQEVEFRAQVTLVGFGSTQPQTRAATMP